MNPYGTGSFLKLQVVWKDADMIELAVTASNGRYSGATEVYDTPASLHRLALALNGFPAGDNILVYEAGAKAGYAFCALRFYPLGPAGLIGVEISLEQNVATSFRPEEKDKVKPELLTEPAALDKFREALTSLTAKQAGQALLYGSNESAVQNGQ